MDANQKPTTCKEAIALWEKKTNSRAADAKVVELQFQFPPIAVMDGSLSALVNCEKLSLSSNMIGQIKGIGGMKNLKILALGRNSLKSLAGIEVVADTLEELWVSYNQIDKLKGIQALKKLTVFYITHNLIRDWAEVNRLQECPSLREVDLIGNPIAEAYTDVEVYRKDVSSRLQHITKLDGIPIIRETY